MSTLLLIMILPGILVGLVLRRVTESVRSRA
jgi:hypothetical protein